jgi:dCMP deaminase
VEKQNIEKILINLRSEFIIIGVTGALGSGCTSSATFISDVNTKEKVNNILVCDNKNEFDMEKRKLERVKYFYEKNEWHDFFHIRVSDLLFLMLIEEIQDYKSLPKVNDFFHYENPDTSIDIFNNEDTFQEIKTLSNRFITAIKEYKQYLEQDIKDILSKTNEYINNNIKKSDSVYTNLFQAIGKNIRTNGSIYKEQKNILKNTLELKEEFKDLNIFVIAEIIRITIKLIRIENKDKKDFFVIDALRNGYEIEFFRNRYQSFYLFSIMASENTRKDRILNSFKLNIDELKNIKKFETNSDTVESQAINTCIGKGDIFINNDSADSSKSKLYLQLIKYIALIRKPGLFTPNDDERFMQVAFTARYNSGCISRQVGAAVVGEDGYLRGFGWNDVPEKHIPCLYRTPQQLISCSQNIIFSEYERSDKFYNYIKNEFENSYKKFLPFCFKDHQSQIELSEKAEDIRYEINPNGENCSKFTIDKEDIKKILEKASFKNPTRERALHAEENAFLQISKSGGESVVNGTLYSTDSPCQLCSKKSMQLKIKRVVYIDAYPDISIEHTLKAGEKSNWPIFDMFSGAIGSAYFKLFVPIIGRKEEIKQL